MECMKLIVCMLRGRRGNVAANYKLVHFATGAGVVHGAQTSP